MSITLREPADTSLPRRIIERLAVAAMAVVILLSFPEQAHASLLSPEAEDKMATFLAIFILFIVPVVLIVLFWLVHILPEQIAHKRHHPQFEAIRTLCLLSLVFGGLLWPLAWIWAYSRPVFHKMAYGSDKLHHGEDEEEDATAAGIHERLARLEERGIPSSELKTLRADLEALEQKYLADEAR
jgi:CBS domain containing-hemolysin-like protein